MKLHFDPNEEEADVLQGDEVSRVVTWQGRSDLASLPGRKVALHLHLARVRVFSTVL